MAGGFEVDPVALRSASPRFDGVGDAVTSAFDRLTGALSSEGACWGDDAAGQAFAKGYRPGADLANQVTPALVDALRAIRTELDASANAWERSDTDGATSFGG